MNSGSGSGSYAGGTIVPVTANPPPPGQTFDRWEGDVEGIADVYSERTTCTVSASGATLTALYKIDTGVEALAESRVRIYGEAAHLVVSGASEAVRVEVFTVAGTLVYRQVVTGERKIAVPSGMYVVKATSPSLCVVRKIAVTGR